ncbi:MAG: 4Fe-4S binding protein [Phycisphaerales bacterium]
MARSHKVVREDGGAKRVSLPVIDCASGAKPEKKPHSRMGRWRAGVLIAVYLVMIAHLVQWLVGGRTLSPVEPSESMQTLEQGMLNAGFIFFALAILSTLIFGRYFCGWGCHIVALQDACGWAMKKMGVRPKPFRSRVLMLFPLGLALYMFVWPNFKRWVVGPSLEAAGLDWPLWLKPVAHIERFDSELLVSDYWATFPDWYIAIPFLAICGFATVYFLGAKGFCTYGCPYGGFFAPVDKVAPFRIRVTDACSHCGHCTAVCTSNVRVHEEVRDFGMVVDPGCMKCMDCVSACPNDALYAGWGRPALGAKPRSEKAKKTAREAAEHRKRRWDLTWGEEVALTIVFLAAFVSTRGMLDQVPLLLAGGLAGVTTFVAWTAWRTVRSDNARLYGIKLRYKGKLRIAGVVFVALALVLGASVAWAGQARFSRWRGDQDYSGIDVQFITTLRPEYQASKGVEARARDALGWYGAAAGVGEGGRGWKLDAERRVRRAYLEAVLGDREAALAELKRAIETGSPTDSLIMQAEQMARGAGGTDEDVAALYRRALELHPELFGARDWLARRALLQGNAEEADRLWREGEARLDDDELSGMLALARFRGMRGKTTEAVELAERVGELSLDGRHRDPGGAVTTADTLLALGERDRAKALLDRAVADPRVTASGLAHAAGVLDRGGWRGDARDMLDRALSREDANVGVKNGAAGMYAQWGQFDKAAELLEKLAAELDDSPWEKSAIGQRLLELSQYANDPKLVGEAVRILKEAADARPDSPTLRHDYAAGLFATGRVEEGVAELTKAAELGDRNAELARRAAQVYEALGQADQASKWSAEATRREAASGG